MRVALVSIFITLIALAVGDTYTTKYDNVDLDAILKSDRLLKNYFDCLMDRGTCTPDGSELKKNIGDALKTDCSKCSDKQKDGTRKVIVFLGKNKKSMFEELVAKYDPDKIYVNKHKEVLAKEGIQV